MKYFLRSVNNLIDLPLEYLRGLDEIVKNASQPGAFLPKSVLLCLGILPMPGETNSYVILAWSDLPVGPKSSRSIDANGVLKKSIAYISSQISTATSAINQKAEELWLDPQDVWKCKACVYRGLLIPSNYCFHPVYQPNRNIGSWSHPQVQALSCLHEIPSEDEFLNTTRVSQHNFKWPPQIAWLLSARLTAMKNIGSRETL